MSDPRSVCLTRKTKETNVSVRLNLDGKGAFDIRTPYPFVNHLLSQLTMFGDLDLTIDAQGDLLHHVVEDVGIALGEALSKALGQRNTVRRFGWAAVPMEGSLALVAVDLVRRPYFMLKGFEQEPKHESSEANLIPHLLRSFAFASQICVHVDVLYGDNVHHALEASFKALGLAFKQAVQRQDEEPKTLSSKGAL